ncbi:TetR/AcrR family transcriptional regulator [Hyphomonas pacifica]|uniref:Uncharacterized protein n=1 Tax=Hyphomonas pacifica TaxID=1280941 RepID=A0A062TZ03_9PROT|nr:TetR/AcrR family transcriptional regulator [Hyphomonas pacifica]KCZ45494.1 hypothetical protein HY2_06575 [Hyphomonas pacifica]RAN35666.1 hypothetical protein HY3_07545 [Hyphomonas pacifica]
MAGKRDQKKREVFDALYQSALRLFDSKGYDAVTVSEITRAAGVAKGTFFNHFPAKADILAEWYRRLMADVMDTPATDDSLPLAEAALEVAHQTISLSAASPQLWQATTQLSPVTPSIQTVEAENDRAVRNHYIRLARRAISKGHLPSDTDPDKLGDLYLTLFTGTVRQCVVTGRREEILPDLKRRFEALASIAARTGLP